MTVDIRPRRSLLNPDLKRPSALSSTPRDERSLWLDKNENLDSELLALSHDVIAKMPASAAAMYPEAGALYKKLARWVGVSPDSLLLTPGSDGAIRLVFEAFVEHGEDVIHTSPTFAMYPVYSQMFGANAHPIEYQRKGAGPHLEVQAVVDAVLRLKPKILCLPNPDSPTGTVVSPEDLRRMLAACESVGALFLLDEAYHPFHAWSAVSWTKESRHLIVARTFAKAWGSAGMRLGYAVAHPQTIALLHKMRPMYEAATFSIEFMSRMLENPEAMERSVARLGEGKAFFVDKMRSLGFQVLPTQGNFLHVDFGARGPAIHAALKDKVLYRAAFDHPSLAGYSRFSVAPKAVMSQVAELIHEALK